MRVSIALYALALAARGLLFALHPNPAYPDSYYYVEVARSLSSGNGFSVDFVYSFLDLGGKLPRDPSLPIPSNGFWMPLASLVQVPSIWLFGPSVFASALPFLLIGALVAPLTWLVARDMGCSRTISLAAAVAMASPAAAAIYATQPDNFSLYQPIGLAALWLTARGLKGDRRAFVLAGLMAGLATLARNDGLLLAGVVGLAFLWDRTRAWRSGGIRVPQLRWRDAVLCGLLFAIAVAPWYLRQLAVFGSLSPGYGSGRLFFIPQYDDIDNLSGQFSLGSYLALGIGSIVGVRLIGLATAIVLFGGVLLTPVLTPFAAVGAWARRRSADCGPFFAYALILTAFMVLLFPLFIAHGTFLHSASTLVPYATILGMEGIAATVAFAARHRRSWRPERATPVFLAMAVALTVASTGFFATVAWRQWDSQQDLRLQASRAFDRIGVGPNDVVFSDDPAGFEYLTGRGGVITPNDSLPVIETIAADYDVRWLVLERASIVEPLEPILEMKPRPDWIGAPAFTIAYTGPPSADPALRDVPALAIFPVCTSPGDTRCAAGGTP